MLRCTRYLLGSLALWIALASLSSCGNKWQRKLSYKELRQLIGELYKADCLMDNLSYSINDTMRLALEGQIFDKYGITRSDFDSIVYHYNTNKPLYFADIVRRASQDIDKELATAQQGKSSSPESLFLPTIPSELSSYNISQLIPESYYPRYVTFSSKASWQTHSVAISDAIPAGSSLDITINVQGLPKKVIEQGLSPIVELSYYASDSLQAYSRSSLNLSSGSSTYTLQFKEELPAGRLSISIFVPGGKKYPAYTLCIRSLQVSFTRGEDPNDNSPSSEEEIFSERLMISRDLVNSRLIREP